MKLTDLYGLYQAIKGYEADFKRAGIGEVVALTGYRMRLFAGRWELTFRRMQ